MRDSEDLSALDDPAFLAERRRVREELEHTPDTEVSFELAARYQKLDEEFLRRASLAWNAPGDQQPQASRRPSSPARGR